MSEQQSDTVASTLPPAIAPGNVAVITGGASGIGLAVAAGVDGGIPASEVGAAVVAAIKAGRFWILTHDSTREASVARVQRAADGVNPPIVLAGS